MSRVSCERSQTGDGPCNVHAGEEAAPRWRARDFAMQRDHPGKMVDCALPWRNVTQVATTHSVLVTAAEQACDCERKTREPRRGSAFATMLFGAPSQICGALVLGHALNTRLPRIAVLVPPMPPMVESTLRAAGWIVRWLPRVRDPKGAEDRATLWSKFNFWALEQAVVFALDTDMLPLLPSTDEILQRRHAAFYDERVQVAAFMENAWPRFNSGAMLLKPGLCTLARLLRSATQPLHWRTVDARYYLGDQSVLNTFFHGQTVELSTLEPFTRSQHGSQANQSSALRAATPFNSDFCRESRLPPAKALRWPFVHLMGVKPFKCPVIGMDCNRHQNGMRCPRGHAAFGIAFNSMPQPLQRACIAARELDQL